jgi:uncharacterized protein (TIGR04255 family)
MNSTLESLVHYDRPPVVEVVCGIHFAPIRSLLVPHLGLLWEKYKAEYPNTREVAPLIPVIERFEGPDETELQISDVPPMARTWFIHKKGNGIIQIQRDRFLHNWRKVRPEDEYPRYHQVIEMFRLRLSQFETFLGENNIGTIEPLQYEMTYINHIPQKEGWKNLNEIRNVFPDFTWRGDGGRFLPTPEGVNWRTVFTLPFRAGRMHVTMRHVINRETKLPLLLLDLTVRGIGTDKSREGMWAWFGLARERIVRGFSDLTGKEVQEIIWKRKE